MRTINIQFCRLLLSALIVTMSSAISAAAATFTVTNTNDSGAGSLRQAVLDANAAATADTIVFDPVVFGTPQTITLATVIQISPAASVDDLTITGPGADLLTIISSGSGSVRILQNSANNASADTTSITGITFAQSLGGNIINYANLTVSNCAFVNNASSANGVGINNAIVAANLNVDSSDFSGNGVTSGGGLGGSISNDGTATVTNSAFSSNISGYGGAIGNQGTLTVSGCTFTNNTATSTSATGLGGGAIYSNSSFTPVAAIITNSTFTGNASTGGGGGGAIRNRSGVMTISTSTFTSNTTASGGGAVRNTGTLTIDSSTFTGNTTTGSGGAINTQGGGQTTINDSFINNNGAADSGGGVYYQTNSGGAFMNVTNTTISNNTANTDSDTAGEGGGVHIEGTGVATVTGSAISGNTVNNGNGGGFYVEGALTLDNSTVSGNSAGISYGGIEDTNPGGTADQVHISNSTIVNNQAVTSCGGFGIYSVSDSNQQSLRNTIIANNTANSASQDVCTASPLNSLGYNLIENNAGANIANITATNIYGQDPLLGSLADNGGPTLTHALLPGGPAIDKGSSGSATTDQRGETRPVDNPNIANATDGDGADIGAYEIQPLLFFSSATYSISENGGTATITVNRVDGGGGPDSVQYATSDGTATGAAICGGGVDYENASGTLTFNSGDLTQTFDVSICDDGTFKGDETINLTLSSPVGATLGTPSAAVLTILNDDTPTPTSTATNTATPTHTQTPSISGSITYGNAIGAPAPPRFVKNVSVASTAGSPAVGPVITGTPGTYTLTGFGSGSYTIKPSKTGGANSAISSFDAARAAQGSTGAVPFVSQNQRFAADVSGNGQVSSLDSAKIAQFAAGLPMQPPNLSGEWRFFVTGAPSPLPTPPQTYDDSRTYGSVTGNLTGEDYVGLLMGEVSGNWNSASHPRPAKGPEEHVTVELPSLIAQAEKEIVIPVGVQGVADKEIIAYEFDLRYDPTVIQPALDAADLKETVSRGLSFVTNPYEPGLLRVVVYGPIPMSEDGVLLNLRFIPVGSAASVSPLTIERMMFNEGGFQVYSNSGRIELSGGN